jgi:DNA-binding response OmpR family regulator
VELLGRTGADVVVLDRHLEDEDGLELCRDLRSRPDAPEVILYTADSDAGLEAAAREAGAFAVIEKGSNVDRLFDAVRLAARAGRSVA